jgi:prevent-host-death family protein
MVDIDWRQLESHATELLRRVEAGERFAVTVEGKPVATLRPVDSRPQWISRETFLRTVGIHQADPALTDVLRDLTSESPDRS